MFFGSVLLALLDELLPVSGEPLSVVFARLGEAELDEPLSLVLFEKLPLPAGLGGGFACAAERVSAPGAEDSAALLDDEDAELGAEGGDPLATVWAEGDGGCSVMRETERSVPVVAEGADP